MFFLLIEQFFLAGLSDLGYACELNDVVWVRKLLNSGAKVNVPDYRLSYPIHFAARHGNVEILTSLIEQGKLYYIYVSNQYEDVL